MRALGRRGPGLVPKKFRPLLDDAQETDRLWPSFRTWVERASAGDIVAAYDVCRNTGLRNYLCYRVGRRELHAALPMLVNALNDPDALVLGEAAEALGRFGDPSTGYDLFKRLEVEDEPKVRFWLLVALGDTRYVPALPALVEALADESPGTGNRDYLARALANIGDKSALTAMRQAFTEEPESTHPTYSAKERIRRAIEDLEHG